MSKPAQMTSSAAIMPSVRVSSSVALRKRVTAPSSLSAGPWDPVAVVVDITSLLPTAGPLVAATSCLPAALAKRPRHPFGCRGHDDLTAGLWQADQSQAFTVPALTPAQASSLLIHLASITWSSVS